MVKSTHYYCVSISNKQDLLDWVGLDEISGAGGGATIKIVIESITETRTGILPWRLNTKTINRAEMHGML